jgi:hypothetical protein
VVSVTDPYNRILGFLDRSRYFFYQVAPQLYSRGLVNPVMEKTLTTVIERRSCGERNLRRRYTVYSVPCLVPTRHCVVRLIGYANCVLSLTLEVHIATGLVTHSDASPPPLVHQFLGVVMTVLYLSYWLNLQELALHKKKKTNSVTLVREQSMPTERPPLVGKNSANFCGYIEPRDQCDGSLRLYSRFSRPERILFLSSSSSVVLTRMSGPRSRPITCQKIW